MPTDQTVKNICIDCKHPYEIPANCAAQSIRCPACQATYKRVKHRTYQQKYKAKLLSTESYISVFIKPTGIAVYNPDWCKSEAIK